MSRITVFLTASLVSLSVYLGSAHLGGAEEVLPQKGNGDFHKPHRPEKIRPEKIRKGKLLQPVANLYELKTSEKAFFPKSNGGNVSTAVEEKGLSLTIQPEKQKFNIRGKGLAFKVVLKNVSSKPIQLYGGEQLGINAKLVVSNQKNASQWNVVSSEKIPLNAPLVRIEPGKEFSTTVYTALVPALFPPPNARPMPMPFPPIRPNPPVRPLPFEDGAPPQNGGGNPSIDGDVVEEVDAEEVKVQKSLRENRGTGNAILEKPTVKRIVKQNGRPNKMQEPGAPPAQPNFAGRPVIVRPVRPIVLERNLPCGMGTCKAMLLLQFTHSPQKRLFNPPLWTGKVASKPVEFEVGVYQLKLRPQRK